MDISIIRDNIDWVKSIFDIVFSASLLIIALLTYKQAKETILQPVRSEVIKKQIDTLIEILTVLEPSRFNKIIDYPEIIRVNATYWLSSYGFVFADKEEGRKIKDKIVGSIFIADKMGRIDALRVSAFPEKEDQNGGNKKEQSRKLYEDAKRGVIVINQIYMTAGFVEIEKELDNFISSPFVPKIISDELKNLNEEIRQNMQIYVVATIQWVINELIKSDGKATISYDGVFNEFNAKRIHHSQTLGNIRLNTRKYLKIDSVPWNK